MHVLMLTNTVAPDSLGGLERYVRELAARLVADGVEVTVVAKRADASHPSTEIGDDGVHVVRYDVPSKRDPSFAVRYAWEVSRAVDRVLSDGPATADALVHGHFPVPALVPALRRTPYVYTLHAPVWRELLIERQDGYLLPAPVQRAAVASLRGAERMVVRRARRIITLSEFMRGEVRYLDSAAAERTEVVPGGVDIDFFAPGATRPTIAGGPDGPVLFTARRHVPRTGVAELIRAMPAVLSAYPEAILRVAGAGPQTPAIAADIERLGLGGRVHLLGQVTAEQLREEYRAADLAVTPTQTLEGFGLATAEALACGTPCIVTPEGANPEVVAPLSPLLVTADSTSAGLALGITRLLRNDLALDAARGGARASVVDRYDWSGIVAHHVQAYRELLEARRIAA